VQIQRIGYDLTGLLETGNKIRKLEFLIGEALAQRADTLITCGTLQRSLLTSANAVSPCDRTRALA
jgi:D-cysteine desulfhydrase